MRLTAALLVALMLVTATLRAADAPPLARARALYNSADFDGAIEVAAIARMQRNTADAAALVEARAHLERYRRMSNPEDLAAAREALGAIRASALTPRDQVDFIVGLGQSLYLAELFGPAADLFESALNRGALLTTHDRIMLLDWWATALDREAQGSSPERRARLFGDVAARMDDELRRDPGSATANYWLAVAARGAGDSEGAWDAAVAAWVRASLDPLTSQALRSDLDRLVTQALIPERARARATQAEAAETLRMQWESVKQLWR